MSSSTDWKIAFPDNDTETEYLQYFKDYPRQAHVQRSFESDVKRNPFYSSTYNRIVPLRGSIKGRYRYSKSETRIIYEPDNTTHTVYPLETSKGTDVSYKKRSRRKQ